MSVQEMKQTIGKGQTCSGIDCNGSSSCEPVNSPTFTGSKKVVYHPHSVCIFTIQDATCTESWTNQICTETFFYTDNACTVLAASTPSAPNPVVTRRDFCGV